MTECSVFCYELCCGVFGFRVYREFLIIWKGERSNVGVVEDECLSFK